MVGSGGDNRSRLQRDNSSIGMSNEGLVDGMVGEDSSIRQQTSISLSLTLAQVVTVVASKAVQVGVVGDDSAIRVTHKTSISLSITLAQVVAVVTSKAVQVGVVGDDSTIGVTDKTSISLSISFSLSFA